VEVGSDVQVTTNTSISWFPSIAWSGSEFGVTWKDDLSGGWQVHFTRVSATGTVLGAGSAVTGTDWAGDEAPLVWAGSVFGLSWDDTRTADTEVYITLLDPTGGRLGTDERLSTTIRDEDDPSLVWTGSEFGVSWDDFHGRDIYFARVSSGGSKLGSEVQVVSTTFGSNVNKASVAWSGSEFGLTWQDDRDGNYEIYFNRIGYCE
jgi:hypothetical protein